MSDALDLLLDPGGSTEPDPDFRRDLMARVWAALDEFTDPTAEMSGTGAEAEINGRDYDLDLDDVDVVGPGPRRHRHRRRRMIFALALVAAAIIALVLVAPLASRHADEHIPAVPPTSPPPTSAAQPPVDRPCPNPDGGYGNHCLGALDPGTYRTTTFEPSFSYTVPSGWWNIEDNSGNDVLLPPGEDLATFHTGVSDYIGVYASVTAPAGCKEAPDPSAATTVQGYVGWLQKQSSLIVSEPKPILVGGLGGTQVDVSLSKGPACSDPHVAGAFMPVLLGTNTSLLGYQPGHRAHRVDARTRLRLDLFDRPDGTLMVIELAEAANDRGEFDSWWTTAADITSTFAFEP